MNPEPERCDILVVDDTPENITVLRDILTRAGHRVRPALRGSLALRAAEAQCPDLVLLDVMMPEMDGYETCVRLKALPGVADVPVLFISALDGTEDKVRAFQAGAVDYVAKPFHAEEVLARVTVHLRLRLARRQLARQNAELEAAARMRDEVDAILRHDLKSPLSTILMAAETLADTADPVSEGERETMTGYIRQMGWTMLEMIHRSLDLLQMERGTYALNPATLDLQACLRQLAGELALTPAGRHASVTLMESGGHPWRVQGETLLCRGLFRNLLKNALEASPPGGVVTVSWDHAGRVTLMNRGEVPASVRPRLFQKFATAGKSGGTGLGGYSARLMAETQGGSVRLEDAPPGHTRISVQLPLPRDPAPPAAPAEVSVSPSRETSLAGLRILVADDDPAHSHAVAHLLSGERMEVILAADGTAALEHLGGGVFSAALIDFEMPGANGPEVARRHRQAGGRTLLVALTAHDGPTHHAACREAGFDHVLVKPVGKGELRSVLSGGSPAPASPEAEALDPDLVPLVPAFLKARVSEREALAGAVRSRDFARSRVLAHRLRGGFGVYGFTSAAELCRQIEQASTAGDFHAATVHLDTLSQTLDRLRRQFGVLD